MLISKQVIFIDDIKASEAKNSPNLETKWQLFSEEPLLLPQHQTASSS